MIRCPGQAGHGSQLLPNTAGEKLQKVINSFMTFREKEKKRLEENKDLRLGDVSTVNLTMLKVRNVATFRCKSVYTYSYQQCSFREFRSYTVLTVERWQMFSASYEITFTKIFLIYAA